ncbi:MAG: ABC transporter ATP-binding protein [Verrucomicrobiota bacterium]|nr:ABC transporter ATP-binding protein [Verrucomicrobiota bacterium]
MKVNTLMPLLEIIQLKKNYLTPSGHEQLVLDVPSFSMQAGQQVALSGESGSGKTTFLHVVAGILPADTGSVLLNERDVQGMPEPMRDQLRANHIGYIFQTFNLLQGYTCLENVLLGMSFGPGVDRPYALQLLKRVGMEHCRDYYPRQLSTGQQQRIAVARALANRPSLVLADEPTGNLDTKHAAEALALIRATCRENEAALLLVSHDQMILKAFGACHDFSNFNKANTGEAKA